MAESSITVQGLDEAEKGIKDAVSRIIPLMLKMSIEAGIKTTNISKGVCRVDTGALQASIHHETVEWTNNKVVERIQAGSSNVVRGVAPYEISSKTGRFVSVKPTSEYAQAVEKRFGYMKTGFDYLKVEIPKLLDKYLQRLFQKI